MISKYVHFDDKYYSKVIGVIQIGMGGGAYEIDTWRSKFIHNQVYIEAYPPYFEALVNKVQSLQMAPNENLRIYNYAMSDNNGTVDFYVNSSGDSHSLFKMDGDRPVPIKHMTEIETISVQSRTLDTLIETEDIDMRKFNLLFMDTQGSEHLIVRGAEKNMKYIDVVTAEIQHVPAYSGALLVDEFTTMMNTLGFKAECSTPNCIGGVLITSDVLYIRT